MDKSERSHREHVIVDLGDGVDAAKLQSTWLVAGVTTIAERRIRASVKKILQIAVVYLDPALVRC